MSVLTTLPNVGFEPLSLHSDPAPRSPSTIYVDLINEEEAHDENDDDENLLVVSPYTSRDHLLDLRSLDTNQRLLAKSLTAMDAIRSDYTTCPYDIAFNWSAVIQSLRTAAHNAKYSWYDQHFFIVVFRSQVPPTTDRTHLFELDRLSHVEATASGGLLKYWFGNPDVTGRNLATCIWRKFEDARPASVGAGHKAATRATMSMYTEWKVERLKLVIKRTEPSHGNDGGVGEWSIVPWEVCY